MADEDFLYAPNEIAQSPEGFVETRIRMEGDARDAVREQERRIRGGLKKMTLHGGAGQDGVAIVGGEVMTVKETVALAIAREMVRDAEQRTGKNVAEIAILELNEGIHARIRGRATTAGAVMAELGRLQNQAIYKDRLRRR